MRGKIVNLCIGFMNILFGTLLFVYTYYVPQELTKLTIQELFVTRNLLNVIYVFLVVVLFFDVFQYVSNKDNSRIKTGYLIGFFSVSFFLIKEPAIACFAIISGIIIITQTFRDTVVEFDSTTAISIVALVIVGIVISIGATIFYKDIGKSIKNKQNENNLEYKSDYFKYVTELENSGPYINVKKDGKYGYIKPNGDVVIDFKYDYASPFVEINVYNKNFQVALVSQNKVSYIILKNERQVMSYRSESSDEDYEAKFNELKDIYANTLGQGGVMKTEIQKKVDNKTKIPVYEELSEDYTYRYDYDDKYDILVTKSKLGSNDKFYFVQKDNMNMKLKLDCKNIDYDEKNLYLYSNHAIPYFDVSEREQGWFLTSGKKNVMKGQAQILDIIENEILLKDYSKNIVYFIDLESHEKLSDSYKEIYIGNNGYIVKNKNNKYMVIDKEFHKIFEDECDIIDTSLAEIGLYIFCDVNENEDIDFNDYNYAKLNWKLLDSNGDTMLENIEQIYCEFYKNSSDKKKSDKEFIESLRKLDFSFVGDKFYENYNK